MISAKIWCHGASAQKVHWSWRKESNNDWQEMSVKLFKNLLSLVVITQWTGCIIYCVHNEHDSWRKWVWILILFLNTEITLMIGFTGSDTEDELHHSISYGVVIKAETPLIHALDGDLFWLHKLLNSYLGTYSENRPHYSWHSLQRIQS